MEASGPPLNPIEILAALGIQPSQLIRPINVPGREEAIAALSAFREGRVPGAIPQTSGAQSLHPELLHVVSEQAPLGFELLSTTEGANDRLRGLTALAQAFANTGNTLDDNFIRRQRIEQNFDNCHELLEELEQDMEALRLARKEADAVANRMEALCEAVEQGDFDEGMFPGPPQVWLTPRVVKDELPESD